MRSCLNLKQIRKTVNALVEEQDVLGLLPVRV